MRIVHVDTGRDMRGGQWQVLRLMEALRASGEEQTLLARAGAPLFQAAAARGFAVRSCGLFAAAQSAARADVVHAHDARGHSLAALVSRCPFVVSRRVMFPIGAGWLSRWKYRRARRYLAVSRTVADALVAGGVPPARIAIVPDGVPLLAPASSEEYILALDTADPAKDGGLLDAAAALAGVEIRRSRSLESDLAHARCFVYLSRAEGLGSAALLAMSAGVPVIASAIGGLQEIIEHERTGLLVRNDPGEIARAILRLEGDALLRGELAAGARQRVIADFLVERLAERTRAIYREVAA